MAAHAYTTHVRLVKHDAGWKLRRRPDGAIEWTSPLGRSYVVEPPSYPIDTTLSSVVSDDNNEDAAGAADAGPSAA